MVDGDDDRGAVDASPVQHRVERRGGAGRIDRCMRATAVGQVSNGGDGIAVGRIESRARTEALEYAAPQRRRIDDDDLDAPRQKRQANADAERTRTMNRRGLPSLQPAPI